MDQLYWQDFSEICHPNIYLESVDYINYCMGMGVRSGGADMVEIHSLLIFIASINAVEKNETQINFITRNLHQL